jgi:mannose-6-phosphate isomerase-like protein (cupin superfamily)
MRLHEIFNNPQTLLEYNKQATLKNWGKRIAQAATFNEQNIGDNWFYSNELNVNTEEELAREVIAELERIDPTQNKQYVMTLIRWYTAVVKVHVQNQKLYAKLRKAELESGAADDWEEGYNEIWPEDYTDLGKGDDNQSADYVTDRATEDWNIDDAEFDLDKIGTQSSFKLEDADQIRDALERFESIKPQLPSNERDIGRYKNFYRFEDFIDDAYDENYVPPETDNETLKRKDVEVLYNGPLGTVTIPKSHEASCALGSGTKWCTTGKNSYFYDSYSSQGDLIIYNEKPGNAKYQIHVTVNGLEARDARDRRIPHEKEREFTRKHPVLSKIIQAQQDKVFSIMAQQPWTSDAITNDGGDPVELVRRFIEFNNKHQGGAMRYVDEYYTQYALPSMIERGMAPGREFVKLMVTYAQQRGKPWPEAQKRMLAIITGVAKKADLSSNVELKTINRLIQQTEELGSTPELEKLKQELTQKIAQFNQTKQEESKPYTQQQITDESFLREFSESVESEELVWHRDRCDRVVKVIEGTGWKFQMDNKLPREIKAGDTITIPAKTYHRIHKGTSKLVVEITEHR